jgi:diamine N-acetyltransferase
MVEIKEITPKNFWEVIDLKVKADQQTFVAANSVSIAQSKVQPECIPLAIYNDNILVGFLMYCIDKSLYKDNEYWIYRLMIDEKYQGKGYGKKAMEIIIDKIKEDKTKNKIKTSFEPENEIAKKLYLKLGFEPTGEMTGEIGDDDREEIVVLNY